MLEVQDLFFSFGQRKIIQDLTYSFAPGRMHAILGPNGAGKSSLLKLLCGILQPSGGSILWNKQHLAKLDRPFISRTITLVPQNPTILFDYTVEEFVAMGRYAHG